MTHNRSLTGAAEAIEKTKNGGDIAETAENAFSGVTESAQYAFDETMESARQVAHDAYDTVGETFRASEDFVRREPISAVAIATAIGLVVGYCFAVRSAPMSAARRKLSRWS